MIYSRDYIILNNKSFFTENKKKNRIPFSNGMEWIGGNGEN